MMLIASSRVGEVRRFEGEVRAKTWGTPAINLTLDNLLLCLLIGKPRRSGAVKLKG